MKVIKVIFLGNQNQIMSKSNVYERKFFIEHVLEKMYEKRSTKCLEMLLQYANFRFLRKISCFIRSHTKVMGAR